MEIKNTKVRRPLRPVTKSHRSPRNMQSGQKRVLFDAVKDGQNVCPKWVPPEAEQERNESRR